MNRSMFKCKDVTACKDNESDIIIQEIARRIFKYN